MKRKNSSNTAFGTFTYRDIPRDAYPYGVTLMIENGYSVALATPEKALCDLLYKVSSQKNQKDLAKLLFEDLRVDKYEFWKLDLSILSELTEFYHSKNHRLLKSFIRRKFI